MSVDQGTWERRKGNQSKDKRHKNEEEERRDYRILASAFPDFYTSSFFSFDLFLCFLN